jgi:5-methylcytosine-specific restriction endonuclease McrA
MIVYSHHCQRCRGTWDSNKRKGDVICRRCWDHLLRVDNFEVETQCEKIIASAKVNCENASQHLNATRQQLSSAQTRDERPLRRLLLRYRPNQDIHRLVRRVADAEEWLESSKGNRRLAEQLPSRLSGPRARFASKEMARAEATLARAEAKLAKQQRQTRAYSAVLGTLVVDRGLLAIGRRDYRRGNAIDNHLRGQWIQRVSEAFGRKCFVCGSADRLTLDHLWLTKNEGGNFVVCLRDAGALVSNVLLLCRSCNAAKGERSIDRLVPSLRIEELVSIQRALSDQMNADTHLRSLATRWYGVQLANIGTQTTAPAFELRS